MNDELVSIIMPAYNSERYIAESIKSVIAQTYQNWELIIIDDGSTDNTPRIVNQYKKNEKRIKYFYQANQKQGKARNNGIKKSRGSLIAFLDSDDLWMPERLKRQVEIIEIKMVDLVFSDAYTFIANTKNVVGNFNTIAGILNGDSAIELFLVKNRIPMLTVLATKRAIISVGGFKEDSQFQWGEDYLLWLKMLLKGYSFYGIPEKLAYYRKHDAQVTGNDNWGCDKIYDMLENDLSLPKHLENYLINAKIIWSKRWYINNSRDKKSARIILRRISSLKQINVISNLTSIVLIILGLKMSKKVISKLINFRYPTLKS
jgi:glycosyltransferase involved in cell wall biosynthesis